MKQPTLNQIVDAVNRAYNITDVRQYKDCFVDALAECLRAESSITSNHDQIAGEKRALTVWNNLLADELEKLYNAQTEDEINEITNDIRSYSISRATSKQNLKFYRNTERSLINKSYAAYKQLLVHYKDALEVIALKEEDARKAEAEALKAEEAKRAAEEASRKADLYTLTRKEAVELLSHITNALMSNKDEQQFLLDMSHYKK